MEDYKVLARRYRPQRFSDVVGQDAIVTTLKHAIQLGRVAHAYLFCGPRGTGKTTLARLFAKSLNCASPDAHHEPCNRCASCKEIASGNSMDVLEVDGASNRGIDEIRQINETVAFAAASGKYKIYIIDEVHMLTKEAFNALLKTLEEPPANVKFFFATTEPHKVLPTILSRCQRFNLSRISMQAITAKLKQIAVDLSITVSDEAFHIIAKRADGGLRDAESLLDQILAFHEGDITEEIVAQILGVVPRDALFALDADAKAGKLSSAFDLVEQVFSQGKDLDHFLDTLLEHYRNILVCLLSGANDKTLESSEGEREKYAAVAAFYSQEQCLTILDMIVEEQSRMKLLPSARTALEALLLRIMRSHQRVPVDYLVRRLAELEESVKGGRPQQQVEPAPEPIQAPPAVPTPIVPAPQEAPPPVAAPPTPAPPVAAAKTPPPQPKETSPPPAPPKDRTDQGRIDTMLQFAAVELEGSLTKKTSRN